MNCGEAFEINDVNCTTEEEYRIQARFALTDHILMKHATVSFYSPTNEYRVKYTDLGEVERCLVCGHLYEKKAMFALSINMVEFTGESREGLVCDKCKHRIFDKKFGEWVN
jgi:hypothetical protein